jgi:alpha-ketoglutarate-dependent taurine dioxygenase
VTETLTSRFEVRPASPLIGAEIEGVDFTQPVDKATAEALREAFWSYKILVFRGQNLSPLQHVEAVRIFDEPFDHPLWVKRHPDTRLVYPFNYKRGTADRWHIGGTWRNPPFHIESLTYQVVPKVGGRTLWADLQAAYDGLSRPVQELLESVSAVYSAYPGDGTSNRPPHRPQRTVHQHRGAAADRRHRGRKPGPAALLAGTRLLPQLHRQLRLEARRLRPVGQPRHLALRRQRLRRAPGLPQGHRRLAPAPAR